MTDTPQSIFTRYAKNLTQQPRPISDHPVADHPLIPHLIDVLSRKNHHHLILLADFSEQLQQIFLEGLAQQLTAIHVPVSLREIQFLSFDLQAFSLSDEPIEKIHNDFTQINESSGLMLFALQQMDWLVHEHDHLSRLLKKMLSNEAWRFILVVNKEEFEPFANQRALLAQFNVFNIQEFSEDQAIDILKMVRPELEEFHQVIFPDDTLFYAYDLARRYLSPAQALDKTFLLLDSSAARSSQAEQARSIVSIAQITKVLSSWTGIPASHLQPQRLKPSDFIRGMQQRLFGQETAIASIGHALQQAHLPLHDKPGVFCSMLFVGDKHVGKKSAGVAVAELLFKQPDVFFYVNLNHYTEEKELINIKVRSSKDKRYYFLAEMVQQTPYAVIYLDHVQSASKGMLNTLEEIFSSGYLVDDQGNHIDFRQAIMILGTTVGAERIRATVQPHLSPQDLPVGDLMQLVLSDHEPGPGTHLRSFSPQALCEDIFPILTQEIPATLLHYVPIVPFVPLDYLAIERIIRLKLKVLANRLYTHYGIEFTYAPEVIRYLIQERLKFESENQSVDKIAEQRVYALVGQVLLAQVEDKNRTNQLFLQLNDTGQLLRCDWLQAAKVV